MDTAQARIGQYYRGGLALTKNNGDSPRPTFFSVAKMHFMCWHDFLVVSLIQWWLFEVVKILHQNEYNRFVTTALKY